MQRSVFLKKIDLRPKRKIHTLLGLISIASLTVTMTAGAAAAVARARAASVDIPFVRYQLPNGLRVILHEDHTLPQVAVNLWYHVGSKDERPGRTGFAHLFEHLMFMGSKNVPYDLEKGAGLFDVIMENQGGVNNATTGNDRTNYYESGPPKLLETFLWLEADRLATLPEVIDKVKVDRQRRIVQNERRQSYENQPYGKVFLLMPEWMYPQGHPYHHPVIGSHADLEAATAADVRDFFRTFYRPSNVSLVIAGDFDPAAARALVEKYFAWIPAAGPAPHVTSAPSARLAGEVRKTIHDKVELPRVYIVYHAPAAFQDGSAESEVLASVLGQGKSSRLERVLRLEKQLVKDVSAFYFEGRLGGSLGVVATPRPGRSLDEIEKAIDDELDAVRSRPPETRELERAVARIETALAQELEDLVGRADRLNYYEYMFGDPGRVSWDLERYRKVSREGVHSLAQKILDRNARLVIRVVPEAKQ